MAHAVHGNGFFHHDFFSEESSVTARKHWGWLLSLGILFVILGTIGFAMQFLVTLATVLYLGVLVMVGGAAQVVQAFSYRGWRGIVSHLLIGLLYLFAAWVMITNPLLASATLTLMLAWTLVFVGAIRIVLAVQHRLYRHWVWPLLSGILSMVLGFMIMAQWPVSGLWIIGLFVSIEMIFHGWSYIGLAIAARRAGNGQPA
jgi:uncharacterized membrane protein HdeD (DUF308 family)